VDVRILSATNHDLYGQVSKGLFREDLLYRINLIQIEVPPLRKRTGDIPLLASYFIEQAALSYSLPVRELSKDTIELLVSRPWPGNVRELKNILERTLLLAKGEVIKPEDFLAALKPGQASASLSLNGRTKGTLDDMEKQMIISTIEECGGNLTRSSEKLGISRATLYRKMERHGIQIDRDE
jgi:DNA-binding NtrC family response regulator